MRSDIDELDFVRNDKSFEPLADPFAEARLEVKQQFLRQAVNVQVALQLAFGGDQRRVATLPGSQAGYVVGDLPVEETSAIRTGHAQTPPETEIDHSRGFAQRCVFAPLVAEGLDDLGAVHIGKAAAEAFVKVVERQWSHAARIKATRPEGSANLRLMTRADSAE